MLAAHRLARASTGQRAVCAMTKASSSGYAHLFDTQAAAYKMGRPQYPQEIYTTILHHLGPDQRQLAVDVATGSGQVATDLASSFVRVLATDPSQGQLDQASQAPGGNISYQQGRAEDIDLPDDSADLVTVAAGLHWFDFPIFYREVQRVLKPHGLLAYWHYQAPTFEGGSAAARTATQLQDRLINETFKSAWAPQYWLGKRYCRGHEPTNMTQLERKRVYSTVSVPLASMVGFAASWSAYPTWKREHPAEPDPVEGYQQDLLHAFGTQDVGHTVEVQWEMQVSVYRNHLPQ